MIHGIIDICQRKGKKEKTSFVRLIELWPCKFEKLGNCVLFPPVFDSILDFFVKEFGIGLPTKTSGAEEEKKGELGNGEGQEINEMYGLIAEYYKCEQIGIQRAIS